MAQEVVDASTGEVLGPVRAPKTDIEQTQSWEKSVSRSRTSIRRAVMAMGGDHLLTLTFRRNETSLKLAWGCFTRFARAVRAEFGEFDYVAVAETQARGAWHFHVAVRGKQDLAALRRCWAFAGGDGNIDVRYTPGRPLWKLAAYLSKYITKSFFVNLRHLHGMHRYRRSQGISPTEHVQLVTIDPKEARDFMHRCFVEDGLVGCAHVSGGRPGEIDHYVWGCTWLEPPN